MGEYVVILFGVFFIGSVIYASWFSGQRKFHDQSFIDKVTVTLNSLNDDPQNEELADSLIKICEDLKQVYSPSILFGLQIIQCYPVHAVFGLLMLKDTGELEGQIPIELLRKLRKITGDTFPVIGMDKLLFVGNQARRYFPDYPDHEKNNYRLSVRVKDWRGLEKPQSVISRPKQEENKEGKGTRISSDHLPTPSNETNTLGCFYEWILNSTIIFAACAFVISLFSYFTADNPIAEQINMGTLLISGTIVGLLTAMKWLMGAMSTHLANRAKIIELMNKKDGNE